MHLEVRGHLFHHRRGSLLVFQLSRQFLVDFRLLCGLNTTAVDHLSREPDKSRANIFRRVHHTGFYFMVPPQKLKV